MGGLGGNHTAHLSTNDFEAFYMQHKQGVFVYLATGLRDQDRAADVLQDVFLKMLEKVKEGSIRSETARNYLYRVARHAMIDAIRKRAQVAELENPDQISYESFTEENSRIRILFTDALTELPDELATVLDLRLLQQMPVDQICIRLKISRATLYRKLEQGLRSIASFFRKAGYDLGEVEV